MSSNVNTIGIKQGRYRKLGLPGQEEAQQEHNQQTRYQLKLCTPWHQIWVRVHGRIANKCKKCWLHLLPEGITTVNDKITHTKEYNN